MISQSSLEHAPQNVMEDGGEIARFHDRCSSLMRELLDALPSTPGRPRAFPQVEDAIGWEIWMDRGQAGAVRAAETAEPAADRHRCGAPLSQ